MVPRSSRKHGYVGVDTGVSTDETVGHNDDDSATVRPQAGNDAKGGAGVRARRRRDTGSDYLSDALALLSGWTRDGVQLRRDLACDDSQHADDLPERRAVAGEARLLVPGVRAAETVNCDRLEVLSGLAVDTRIVAVGAGLFVFDLLPSQSE